MLALEYQAPQQLRVTDRPPVSAAEGDLVVDVVVAGICGTDLKIARGEHRLYPPATVRVPGHEIVGTVAESRSTRPDLKVGELVALAPNISCGACPACRAGRSNLCVHYACLGLTIDGGFAESVVIPRRAVEQGNAIPVPTALEPLVAVLMEPLAAVLRGTQALALSSEDSLVIIGAGPIGLLAVLLAKQLCVARVIVSQTSAARRKLARHFGADLTIDPRAENLVSRVVEETAGRGADCVLVAAPAPAAYSQSVQMAAVGGRINFFAGLPSGQGEVRIDANLVHYRELLVTGSTANTTQDCVDALAILAAHPDSYRRLITHRFALADAERAIAVAASGDALKVVVQP
jgi:threonine dehydrogenase-like Zn-dependent dehydrogenase